MNPLGGLVTMLGVVLILIGISGTQRNVAQALRGSRPTGGGGPFNKAGSAVGGFPGAPAPSPGPFGKAGSAVGGFPGPSTGLVPQGPGRSPQLAPQTGGTA